MSHSSSYFMHDQMRHRVAHIMRANSRPREQPSPIWPLIGLIALLTIINVLAVIPVT